MRLEVSNLYSKPNSMYLVHVGSYCILHTDQFTKFDKGLTLFHVEKCIPALKWIYFEIINSVKTSYYSQGDKKSKPLCR